MDETFMLVDEFQAGLLLADMDKPTRITISTYDIDMTLFMTEFYEPTITYDIWYWLSTRPCEVPRNVRLHQLNNNHCKFWYIESARYVRLVITSCNLTYQMVHGCQQSYYAITVARRLPIGEDAHSVHKARISAQDRAAHTTAQDTAHRAYNMRAERRPSASTVQCAQFFAIFAVDLEESLLAALCDRLVYNIPNRCNGIERWFMRQTALVVDANNVNMAYLDNIPRTIYIRTEVPPSVSTVVCYYRLDHSSRTLTVRKSEYSCFFHYKLYFSNSQLLVTSNNFSYHHKLNYELGIIIQLA